MENRTGYIENVPEDFVPRAKQVLEEEIRQELSRIVGGAGQQQSNKEVR